MYKSSLQHLGRKIVTYLYINLSCLEVHGYAYVAAVYIGFCLYVVRRAHVPKNLTLLNELLPLRLLKLKSSTQSILQYTVLKNADYVLSYPNIDLVSHLNVMLNA
jgi:hypothetical protein